MRNQVLKQVERRCIEPLQIIEKQGERMLLAREHAKKAPEHHLEAVLRIPRRQTRDWRLFPDHELQLGNKIDHEPVMWAQRIDQRLPPPAKLCLALAAKRTDE